VARLRQHTPPAPHRFRLSTKAPDAAQAQRCRSPARPRQPLEPVHAAPPLPRRQQSRSPQNSN
jgi:hypothetical protein